MRVSEGVYLGRHLLPIVNLMLNLTFNIALIRSASLTRCRSRSFLRWSKMTVYNSGLAFGFS